MPTPAGQPTRPPMPRPTTMQPAKWPAPPRRAPGAATAETQFSI
jgi:hypothetical protein